jgi:hypothetical protein
VIFGAFFVSFSLVGFFFLEFGDVSLERKFKVGDLVDFDFFKGPGSFRNDKSMDFL